MTELRSERFVDLERWSTESAVEAMLEGQLSALAAVLPQAGAIAAAAESAAARLGGAGPGRLLYAGAGTSGRIAVQDGVELGPTFGWPAERLGYAIAGGLEALWRGVEGAEDDAEAAEARIGALKAGPADVLIAVAASGGTPYTLRAVEAARRAGALTIGVSNNRCSALDQTAEIGLCAPTGQEILAGSTRMKAGTAQKAILNAVSTAIMIRLGRVHDGLMVDMVVSNAKLRKRALGMIVQVSGVDRQRAEAALAHAGDNIKRAVLLALGADLDAADRHLAASGGVLRGAIAQLKGAE